MDKDRKKILWISPFAPYEGVSHAGGVNHYYYIKKISKSHKFDIFLLSLCERKNISKMNFSSLEINGKVLENDNNKNGFINCLCKLNPFDKYANIMTYTQKKNIFKLVNSFYIDNPEIVILHWTQVGLLLDTVKKIYPKSKIIIIEEDVSFLSYRRKYEIARGLYKIWRIIKYCKLKKIEIKVLSQCDLIVTLNGKDTKLLIDNGIPKGKIFTSSPYFHNYFECKYQGWESRNLLFFGAMQRKENYLSAIWFIENILYKLDNQDFRLIIVGGTPNEKLIKYESARVKVLGFVEDVKPYFESSLCLVAPLVLGAGIKVKILEAMSAGLPVITNEIGIEGINANPNEDYLLCHNKNDYLKAIKKMQQFEISNKISLNCKKFINKSMDVDVALRRLEKELEKM